MPNIPDFSLELTSDNNSINDFREDINYTIDYLIEQNQYLEDQEQALQDRVNDANNFIPTGAIMIWAGASSSIPRGWVLCDGQNQSPDLRDKFIVGAGKRSVGEDGGENLKAISHTHTVNGSTVTAGAHTHGSGTLSATTAGGHTHSQSNLRTNGVTNAVRDHTHGTTGRSGSANSTVTTTRVSGNTGSFATAGHTHGTTAGMGARYTGATGNFAHTHTLSGNTLSSGSHSHGINGNTGSTGSHSHTISGTTHSEDIEIDTRPPYYALTYIMKV